jgi:uncharacterized protein (TIRG00374 family)
MSDEVAAVPRRGAGWKLALRLGVTAVVLGVLIWKVPEPGKILPDDHVATLALLFGALVTAFVGVVLSAWRWQQVLVLFDRPVPLVTLTRHYLAGMFVGNVLPSTIGGDVVRVTRATPSIGSASDAFGSVVLERLTGFVALPVLVFTGFALRPSLLDAPHAWIALLVAGATLAALSIVLFVAGHPRIAGRFASHENWMRFIGAVHRGVDRLRREPRHLVPVLGTAIIYQASIVVMFGFIFRALAIPVPVFGLLAFAPAVLMLQVLPISLAGFAVREGALVLFLHSYLDAHGLPDSRAIAAGLLWYGCMLVVSMLGAPAFAFGHKQPERPAAPEPLESDRA